MYGAQAVSSILWENLLFENDVEMYGAQANSIKKRWDTEFENDVEMYGAQANHVPLHQGDGLRMM